jgi:hypothetical protein
MSFRQFKDSFGVGGRILRVTTRTHQSEHASPSTILPTTSRPGTKGSSPGLKVAVIKVMRVGEVDPRSVDADDSLAVLLSREHHLSELQHLWPAELIDADCSHSWYLLPLEGHMVQKVRDPHSQQRLDSTLHILRLEQRTSCIKDHLVGVADTGVKVFADQPLCDMMR